MASTPEGRRLTEQHRQAQLALRAEFLAQFLGLWPLLDSRRLDETSPGWVAAVLLLIRSFRERSAQLSTGYFVDFRQVELPAAAAAPGLDVPATRGRPRPSPSSRLRSATAPRPTPQLAGQAAPQLRPERRVQWDFDDSAFRNRPDRRVRIDIPEIDWTPSDRAAVVSLNVTGPVSQKSKAARGRPLQAARDESFIEAAGAGSRHVLTGGRRSLLTLLESDPQAVGWVRVTDGDPCAFCAMLASRGITYTSEASAGLKAHDRCACTAEIAYSRNGPLPGRAQDFRDLWAEVVGFAPNNRYSGAEAIRAFRREYERRQREARRQVA